MQSDAKMSDAGVRALVGFEQMVLHVYPDAVGIPTVCVGRVVQPGDTWVSDGVTRAECDQALKRDLARFERCVVECVAQDLHQSCFDAMVSLAFNIGTRAFEKSTVVACIRDWRLQGAADAFLLWRFASVLQKDGSHVRKPILLARRMAERDMFLLGMIGRPVVERDALEVARSVMFDVRDMLNDDGSERLDMDAEPLQSDPPYHEANV